jgi:hypothetical protein
MCAAKWIFAALVSLSAAVPAVAAEGSGLTPSAEQVPWTQRWQGRLSLSVQAPSFRTGLGSDAAGLQITGLSLMGDYYFARPLPLLARDGGFRATSGLILGGRAPTWGARPQLGSQTGSLRVERRPTGTGLTAYGSDTSADSATTPYVGLGYSGLSAKRAWSFSADLGLVALAAGNAVKLGRVFHGGPTLDDVVRDMRVAPIVQLGVSYSF